MQIHRITYMDILMGRRIPMKNHTLRTMSTGMKTTLLLLDGFLLVGLLSYSIFFFTLNMTLNPADLSGESGELIAQRFYWRDLSEKILAVCGVIYLIGHICVISYARKKKISFSLKALTVYFFIQIGIMIACVVPFGLLDRTFFWDYLFPLWSLLILTSLLFLVSLLIHASRKVKPLAT